MIEHSALRIPHGIADPEGNVAYVVGPEGLIHCLELGSGEILARTDFPASPLTIDRGTLIGWRPAPGQPNAVRLFAAVRQGNVLRMKWEKTLYLPDWVEVDSLEANRFTLEATIESKLVVVTWEAHSRYRGGAPPPPQVEEAATHEERRTVRLDPETGAAVGQERTEPALSLEEQVLPEVPPTMRIVPYRSGTSWVTQSWRVGSADAFLARTVKEPGIVLVRHDPAGAAGPSEIRLTNDPAAEAAVTPDGRMVFIHEPGGDAPAWHVFSAETGDRITRLPFDPGTEGVAVVNDQVLYLVVKDRGGTRRRSLRSRNLQTGEAMWSFLLSEETLRAPPPLRP
jgi:hypothetical protein